MATKTISLTEDAYLGLLSMKRPNESFSDVVRRLTGRGSLLDLCGILPREATEALAHNVDQNRKDRMAVRRKELGL